VTSPAPGDSNVPLNVVIDIVVFADPMPADIETQFSLFQQPGFLVGTIPTRVDSNVAFLSTIRLRPSAFLTPGAHYEIRQGASPLATFMTGISLEGTPPDAPTGASATVNAFDSHPDGGSDCITDQIRKVRLSVPSPSRPVVYTIKEGTQAITSFDSNLTGSFYCSGQAHWQGEPLWVISPGQHTVQLSAIDRAGNSSTTVDVSFNASCAGGPDGGTSDGGGGNGSLPGDTNTTVPVQPSSGCSCGTGVSAAIALAGFATILRARRRKPAASKTSSEP
jgi:uncharacterized protein (TIGR03382 family)